MDKEMSRIVKVIVDIAYSFALTFGFYVIIHGHLTPGGGFQGGAVAASAFAMLVAAHGIKSIEIMLKKDTLSTIENIGALIFIITAFLGLGTTFFFNFLANSETIFGEEVSFGPNTGDINTGGVLPIMNIAVGMKVFAGIGVVLLVMFFTEKTLGGEKK